jgi:hypothetical protein
MTFFNLKVLHFRSDVGAVQRTVLFVLGTFLNLF